MPKEHWNPPAPKIARNIPVVDSHVAGGVFVVNTLRIVDNAQPHNESVTYIVAVIAFRKLSRKYARFICIIQHRQKMSVATTTAA